MNELRSDQTTPDSHTCSVVAADADGPTVPSDFSGGHRAAPTLSDDAATAVAAGEAYSTSPAVADLITKIRSAYKRRNDHMRSEIALTLRIKASCRRMVTAPGKSPDATLKEADILYNAMLGKNDREHPLAAEALDWNRCLLAARDTISPERQAIEKYLANAAMLLPVHAWVKAVRGFGDMSLACLVGEGGDIGSYRSVAGLWKRFGLGMVETVDEAGVVTRSRQRLVANNPELAIRHAYSPSRRSVVFVIGDVMVKMNRGDYRAVYDARKTYEIARDPEIKPIVAHRRAQRYMEKRLLKHLRQAWRAACHQTATFAEAPPAYRSAAQDEPYSVSHKPQSRRTKSAAPIPSGTSPRPSFEYDASRPQATIHEPDARDNQASPAPIDEAKQHTESRNTVPRPRAAILDPASPVNHAPRAPISGANISAAPKTPARQKRTANCQPATRTSGPPSAPSSGACIAAEPDSRARQPRPAVVNPTTNSVTPAAPVHATAKETMTPRPGRGGARAAQPPATPKKHDAHSPRFDGNGRQGVRSNGVPPLSDHGADFGRASIKDLTEQDA